MLTTIEPPGWIPMKMMVLVFVGIWSPTFFTWLAVVIFDSKEMRDLMHEAVTISTAGPYLLYWLALGDMFIGSRWTDWGWYVALVLMLAYSVASICYEAIFVPKVTRWLH